MRTTIHPPRPHAVPPVLFSHPEADPMPARVIGGAHPARRVAFSAPAPAPRSR
ncbi:hypothetical protein [Amycolatopsis minnesotensis]|uniref:hypothetical protein n=1 Tax=Amycolatopsis minnesotensis TaxID=337894 RepID=UPI0031D4C5AD